MKLTPPKRLLQFLRWFCREDYLDEIEGDLTELFIKQAEISPRKAKWIFGWRVIKYFRPEFIKSIKNSHQINTYDMLNNYFKIAWRVLLRKKTYSAINIIGLAFGLTCSLLFLLWSYDEIRVDSFHLHSDRLYSVYERVYNDNEMKAAYFTQGLLAQELKTSIPEIEYACSFRMLDPVTFQVEDKIIKMEGACAGEDFFKMFSYKVLHGNMEKALSDPSNIAISQKMATTFFESPEKAIGQVIRFENRKNFRVSAVFENIPDNSSLKFEFLSSWEWHLQEVRWLNRWIYRAPLTFILLRSDSKPIALESKIKNFVKPYLQESHSAFYIELGLQRFDKKYLYSTFNNGVPDGGRVEYVRLFSFAAIFILLIACINFMNLATARTLKRAKEIGVRKTIGAARSSLTTQFMMEAMFLVFLSAVISIVLVILLLPTFNEITNKHISLPFTNLWFWLIAFLVILSTGLVAGSYPALFLSSLNPIKALKGSVKFEQRVIYFRKALVTFQFILAIVIISAAIIVSRQVQYIYTKGLGYDKDNLIYIPLQGNMADKFQTFRQQAMNIDGITNVTRSVQRPTHTWRHVYDLDWPGKNSDSRGVAVHNGIDYNFIESLDLKIIHGRNFSLDNPSDSTGYIVNEAALKMIGSKDPIGLPLSFFSNRGEIIGVVKDFHLTSFYSPIEPLVLFLFEDGTNEGYILVKVNPTKTNFVLSALEKIYKEMEPGFLFTYEFAEDHHFQLYKDEQVASTFSNYFAAIAIVISALGLFGLSMFTAEQRAKEIGVRKVLGASFSNIFFVLSKDFTILISIAVTIAIPCSYFIAQNWLSKYAYKIALDWLLLFLPVVILVVVTFITIAYQLIKAALVNPVNSLKSE